MSDLDFGPLRQNDVAALPAIIQGEHCYCSTDFNTASVITLTARHHGQLVGFITGKKGYGTDASVITLSTPFLHTRFNDAAHIQEIRLALINLAQEHHGITHYRNRNFDTPRPIGIDHLIPAERVALPEESASVPTEEYLAELSYA